MSQPVEFSRPVRVETLPRDGLRQKIAANEAERAALALRFHLPAVDSLEAELIVKRSGRGVRVTGEARAHVLQTCIVSLEPFPVDVVEEVDLRFAPPTAERRKPPPEGEEIRFDVEDEPDPLIDNTVDLGEVAAEFIALGLDPYPRKPGVEFEEPEQEEPPTPFSVLAALRASKEGK